MNQPSSSPGEDTGSTDDTGSQWSDSDLTVYVIRHGHRADKQPDYDGGWNTPLSDIGHEQADHVGSFLADEGLDTVYSSCSLRALQTARPIHRKTDVEWHVWPVFDEFANRTWQAFAEEDPEEASQVATWQTGDQIDTSDEIQRTEGDGNYYRLSELQDRFPPVELSQPFPYPDEWWRAQGDWTRTNGIARIELGVQALLDRHKDGGQVAIACHTQSGAALVSTLVGLPFRHQYRHFSFDNAGITRLDRRTDDRWLIKYANRIAHLPPELRI